MELFLNIESKSYMLTGYPYKSCKKILDNYIPVPNPDFRKRTDEYCFRYGITDKPRIWKLKDIYNGGVPEIDELLKESQEYARLKDKYKYSTELIFLKTQDHIFSLTNINRNNDIENLRTKIVSGLKQKECYVKMYTNIKEDEYDLFIKIINQDILMDQLPLYIGKYPNINKLIGEILSQ